MTDCIFCRIIQRGIPCHKIYEDREYLAFLDIHPHAQGHTVVIPKKHAETLSELKDRQGLGDAIQNTMARIQDVLHPEGFNVGWNEQEAGGQAVPHLHVHIMPRWKNDGGGSMHSIIKNPGSMSVEEVARLF